MAALSFEILDCISTHGGFDKGYYRILVASKVIKYFEFHDPNPRIPDYRGERLTFSTVPTGDWSIGRLVEDTRTQQLSLESVEAVDPVGIENVWHETLVDWLDLSIPVAGIAEDELQCMHRMYCAVYKGCLGYDKVVVDHDWYPWNLYGPEHETDIYALIDGHYIAPEFIAHVTENRDRVIGYMVESVSGRVATVDDLPACQAVLRRLHALGIALGSLWPSSFIVDNDRVFIQGFGGSYQTDDQNVLTKE